MSRSFPIRILCLDQDPAVLHALRTVCAEEGAEVRTLNGDLKSVDPAGTDVDALLATLREVKPAAVLVPLDRLDMSRLELLRALHRENRDAPVVVTAPSDSLALSIPAMQAGVYDFLTKPLDAGKLRETLGPVLAGPGQALRLLPPEGGLADALSIVGRSEGILQVYKTIGRVANTSATVLIMGGSGTGKELVARVIHQASARGGGPFLAVNCAAIPENLLESELFGYEKGAFTGAAASKIGKFERAAGGTLFLDEIGDMSLSLQSKILRVLQEREIERVGGEERISVDVRIIAATNHQLEREVKAGEFREDLYFRLAVVKLALPPLCERREDIPLLIDHFTRVFASKNGKLIEAVSCRVYKLLERHPWPGNIRQLRNALERAVIMCQGRALLPEHLPPELFTEPTPQTSPPRPASRRLLRLEEVERLHILAALEDAQWNLSAAAEILGIHRNTLRRKARKLGLHRVA